MGYYLLSKVKVSLCLSCESAHVPVFLSFDPLTVGCVSTPLMQPPANAGAVEREDAASPNHNTKNFTDRCTLHYLDQQADIHSLA